MCVRERVCVSVCVRERVRVSVCMCVRVCARECMCVGGDAKETYVDVKSYLEANILSLSLPKRSAKLNAMGRNVIE